MKRWIVAGLLCTLACSPSATNTREQLESEQKALRSLDAEAQLLERLVIAHRVPGRFASAHARYIDEAMQEHLHKLK
jgi:hypothetical protein